MKGQASATYLYCLLEARRAPSLARAPRGLPGTGNLRRIPVGEGRWLITADAPLPRYGAAAIERGLKDLEWVSRCALAHEAVVEHVAAAGTVVPMKLFTLFASDERALAHLARLRRRLDKVLAAVAGRSEWGVRVRADLAPALARAGAASRRAATGVAFLSAKKEERDLRSGLSANARAEADRIFEELALIADDSLRRPPSSTGTTTSGAGLVLDGVFLVAARARSRFAAAVRRHATRLAGDGFEIVLSGPWPPYHFVASAA